MLHLWRPRERRLGRRRIFRGADAVWAQVDILGGPQGAGGIEQLPLEHVQAGPGELRGVEGLIERLGILGSGRAAG
jgi:hypothetical protein